MKTIKEVYAESLEKISKQNVVSDIANEIQLVAQALRDNDLQNWSPDQLSRALTKIAVLRVNLGSEMADAMAYYDFSYTGRKIRYASEWKPTKSELNQTIKATIQDIDSKIITNMADEMNEEIQSKHYAEKLKIIYDASETLITALQSRINVLKQERIEARNG